MSHLRTLANSVARLLRRLRGKANQDAPTTLATSAAKPSHRPGKASKPRSAAKPKPAAPREMPPLLGKAAIQAMPDFPGLNMGAITVVQTNEAAIAACTALTQAGVVGFDTEARPTFNKGEHPQGPHLIQLSTDCHAYLFPVVNDAILPPLRALLESPKVIKVGFDLRSDKEQLVSNCKVHCQGIQDLVPMFRQLGYRNTVGAVQAVALLLNQHYRKSKSAKMSNWAQPKLTESQQRYAANDAYVALRVYRLLQKQGVGADRPRRK